MKLVFLPEAEADIDRLYEFLIQENRLAAQGAMLTIDEGAKKLEQFPEIGISMDDGSERRELYLPFGKSVYVYLSYSPGDNPDQGYGLE